MKRLLQGAALATITLLLSGCSIMGDFGDIDRQNAKWAEVLSDTEGVAGVKLKKEVFMAPTTPEAALIVTPEADLASILETACSTKAAPATELLVRVENAERTRRVEQKLPTTCSQDELLPLKDYYNALPSTAVSPTLEVQAVYKSDAPAQITFGTFNPDVKLFPGNQERWDNREAWAAYEPLTVKDYVEVFKASPDDVVSFGGTITLEPESAPYDPYSDVVDRLKNPILLARSTDRLLTPQEKADAVAILQIIDSKKLSIDTLTLLDEGGYSIAGADSGGRPLELAETFPGITSLTSVQYGQSGDDPMTRYSTYAPENTNPFLADVSATLKAQGREWNQITEDTALLHGDWACSNLSTGAMTFEQLEVAKLTSTDGDGTGGPALVTASLDAALKYLCPELAPSN